MELEITCPSGLQGTIRSLKMRDVQAISQMKSNRRGDFMRKVLDLAWVGATSLGIYKEPFTWENALLGDAFYAFVQTRVNTYGKDYECDTICPRCQKAEPQTVDLSALEVHELPETSRERFATNKLFVVDVDSTSIGFKLLTLRDERGVGILMEKRNVTYALASLAQRTQQMDGRNVIPGEALAFYEGLDAGIASEFDQFIESLDCGLDTTIDCVCVCGARYTQKLPLAEGFFSTVLDPKEEKPRFTLSG